MLFGLLGSILLLLTIVFGPSLAPYSMDELHLFKKIPQADGTVKIEPAPQAPDGTNLLGTDQNGRDVLSKILRGARITVTFAVLVALLRVVVGLPLAYLGASFPRTVGWLNEKLSLAFTTIPAVLIVFLVVIVFIFSDAISPTQILLLMSLLIALVGLFPTAYVIQGKMDSILKSPFMEGQRAIGTGRWRILRKHIMPHLSTYVMVLLVSEIAQTLWLAGQLGVMSVFLGGSILEQGGPINMRYPEEWAGSIGYSYQAFRSHPMMVLYPVFALSFAILSFHTLADGIRKHHERKWGISL
ncbi:ABC-type dipeptide/oligopeptide/nickel transport system permease subunit [Tumebacillus permanentifrigoris]|uniref:ABC-type dipeptide/oligopeptide/nickel transport system permease subunit n=1 Tax=Tumebacillus permanentifrigoris TaxID=378543 RepID=A0A316D716_9BACL|nr:ABC-type dipeptide/oligopeptide/nickel transport system permease subunit [Tumebacillus permanentifrigoris]